MSSLQVKWTKKGEARMIKSQEELQNKIDTFLKRKTNKFPELEHPFASETDKILGR